MAIVPLVQERYGGQDEGRPVDLGRPVDRRDDQIFARMEGSVYTGTRHIKGYRWVQNYAGQYRSSEHLRMTPAG